MFARERCHVATTQVQEWEPGPRWDLTLVPSEAIRGRIVEPLIPRRSWRDLRPGLLSRLEFLFLSTSAPSALPLIPSCDVSLQ